MDFIKKNWNIVVSMCIYSFVYIGFYKIIVGWEWFIVRSISVFGLFFGVNVNKFYIF